MSANISEGDKAAPTPLQYWLPFIGLGAAASAFAVYAIVEAPAMWRATDRFKAQQIQQEDRTYCEKFRMPPGSESFATCVTYLAEIRARHEDRLAAQAVGLL